MGRRDLLDKVSNTLYTRIRYVIKYGILLSADRRILKKHLLTPDSLLTLTPAFMRRVVLKSDGTIIFMQLLYYLTGWHNLTNIETSSKMKWND